MKAMSGLEINCEVVRAILTRFIRNEVGKFGFECVVVGLSGGVDSSLSCFLGADALGKEGVIGVLMPYKTSSPESIADARLVVQQLGIESVEIDITPQIDAYFERLPEADRMRRGNKMARERMTILYDLSMKHKALVLGTSNKTEFLLGYTTLWGDMACAINPIGDLYKTQVRQLAAHLGVPERIVKKPPSADLWRGQTDEEEMGLKYEEVDRLLFMMVDERRPRAEIERHFDPAFAEKVARMVQGSQYKRRLPVIAKISARSIDRDFRYSRDWGR
jgi:NAD+ synthase